MTTTPCNWISFHWIRRKKKNGPIHYPLKYDWQRYDASKTRTVSGTLGITRFVPARNSSFYRLPNLQLWATGNLVRSWWVVDLLLVDLFLGREAADRERRSPAPYMKFDNGLFRSLDGWILASFRFACWLMDSITWPISSHLDLKANDSYSHLPTHCLHPIQAHIKCYA